MAIRTVGPNSTYSSIDEAMNFAGPNDTIQLEAGYSNETATVDYSGMTIFGEASSTGIVLQLAIGVATVTLTGAAPINVRDSADGNNIVGNDGDNFIRVSAGADAVSGGLGEDRLVVDYRLATGAVTGNSTSNFAEAGGGGRLVTINGGFEHFTVRTGSGADTLTVGAGNNNIRAGSGANAITAGDGINLIIGGRDADTIVVGDGGNRVLGGGGANTITTGAGADTISSGGGADTIVAGAGTDNIEVSGGADTVDAGAAKDVLVVDYGAALTAVTGGVASGDLATGYGGHIADLAGATVDFVGVESFRVTTGSGDDAIITGDGRDRISSGAGEDVLRGGGGKDTLAGGLDGDRLLGQKGDDILAGGEGRDTLRGGAGSDWFEMASVDANDADRIVGFAPGADKFALDGDVFGLPEGALAEGNFVVGNHAQDADDRLIYKEDVGKLYFDADGNGAGAKVLIANFYDPPTLSASDFVVI